MKLLTLATVLLVTVLASTARAQEASREEFQELCKGFQGRWVGDVTWVTDWPGLGKRGAKVTAYYEGAFAEDGQAFIHKFYGGNGASTGLMYYEAGAKQIKADWVDSGGTVSHDTLYKKDGKWNSKSVGSKADGTKTESISTLTITDNGNTYTWTGSGTVGGKKVDDQHDVWRRVSK